MNAVTIENGCAVVPAGAWLTGRSQPVACRNIPVVRNLRGFIVPDRAAVQLVETSEQSWCASAEHPFLTRLDVPPDETLSLISDKLLVAPADTRVDGSRLKLVPMSFARTSAVTRFQGGWVVAAVASRVTRVSLAKDESLYVRPEALVAWIGNPPVGHCPRLRLLDMLLPRGPKNLVFLFHGPAVVWFEGSRKTSGGCGQSVRMRVA